MCRIASASPVFEICASQCSLFHSVLSSDKLSCSSSLHVDMAPRFVFELCGLVAAEFFFSNLNVSVFNSLAPGVVLRSPFFPYGSI